MKPVLHIIGLGWNGLEKLPLQVFRLLVRADKVLVISSSHPAADGMLKEGIVFKQLFSDKEITKDMGVPPELLAEKILSAGDFSEAVLALPGNPLPEGKTVRTIIEEAGEFLTVNTDTLKENSLTRLAEIMTELRSDWGCPWDKEQDHWTLKRYLLEETYEVIEAINSQNMNNFCEELGDLLLQVVFHAQIAKESGNFTLEEVIKGICDKLIRRHPHVFGSVIANSSSEVLANWEEIKKEEKTGTVVDYQIDSELPALLFAEKIQRRAAKIGFDWDNYSGPLAKVREELDELEKEIDDRENREEEMGDILFSIVNLSRALGVNAEESLRQATKKFQQRFDQMLAIIEEEKGKIPQMTLENLDFYWNRVKKMKKNGTLGSNSR
jgi:tetrapyrrole methylase family protein/MazG family protein